MRPASRTPPPRAERLGHVWLVGAGPGHPGYLTRLGEQALRRAEVVFYDRLAPPALLDLAPPEARLIDAGKAAGDHTLTQDEISQRLVEEGRAGRRVVRLKGGDPFVFGRGSEELMALADAGIPCTVIPGTTSAIAGLAAAGIPVTHRGLASSFAVVTGHEDPTKAEAAVDWRQLATAVDTIVVLMGVARLASIAKALVEGGRDASTPAALVQEASTPTQRTLRSTLGAIAEEAAAVEMGAPALLVVGAVAALHDQLDPAKTAPLAGKQILVTRSRQQASTLVERLALEGASPLVLPAIEIAAQVDHVAFKASVVRLIARQYDWAVFTSANAVERYLDALTEHEASLDSRSFAGSRIAAIGPATADALRGRGLIADLVPAEALAEQLAAAIVEQGAGPPGRVLLPRALGGREVLPNTLRAAGATVDEVTLYFAAPPAEAPSEIVATIRSGAVDIVTFTSSSTVRNLVEALGGDLSGLEATVVAAIGPATAATAEECGLSPAVVASEHTIDGLVDALREHEHNQSLDRQSLESP
jgi:uroporphyrinogen III methyltransferase/synthase